MATWSMAAWPQRTTVMSVKVSSCTCSEPPLLCPSPAYGSLRVETLATAAQVPRPQDRPAVRHPDRLRHLGRRRGAVDEHATHLGGEPARCSSLCGCASGAAGA